MTTYAIRSGNFETIVEARFPQVALLKALEKAKTKAYKFGVIMEVTDLDEPSIEHQWYMDTIIYLKKAGMYKEAK